MEQRCAEVNGKTLYIAASDSHGGGGENHRFFVFLSIGEGGYSYTQEEEPNDSAEEATEPTQPGLPMTMEPPMATPQAGERSTGRTMSTHSTSP